MTKRYQREPKSCAQPKYAADPLTHEVAKKFYKSRGKKLKDVVDALLLWNMDQVEREERRRLHEPAWKVRELPPIGLALPEEKD
jgi:hypothetical protein